MWKYNIVDFNPCDTLYPGKILEFLPNVDQHHLWYIEQYSPATFIKWVNDCRCQDSCIKYHMREARILVRNGETRLFHPLWLVLCRDCKYFK